MKNLIHPDIKVCFSQKVDTTSFKSEYYSKRPLLTVYRNEKPNTYTVDMTAFIPKNLISCSPHNPCTSLIDNTVFLSYSSQLLVDVPFHNKLSNGDAALPNCAKFTIEFDAHDPKAYDFYFFQFELTLPVTIFKELQGIIVYSKNEDPKTSRGTVTAVRDRGH